MADDLDGLVQKHRPWPYQWLQLRNAEGRRHILCTRCGKKKRVPLIVEQSGLEFARLCADWITRHRGCVQKPVLH